MQRYSWEREVVRRAGGGWGRWIWTAVGVIFVLGVAGVAVELMVGGVYLREFERIAEEFDLEEVRKMEAASVLFDRNGEEIGKLFLQNRNPVRLREISPYLVQAVIAAEDNRFYQHDGVDWYGVVRALVENLRQGRIAQGASTITQQLARNTYEMRERTYQRKLVEMFLARRIEQRFSKQEIMEMYLNRVYFGSGFYGAESAARGYFGKSAAELGIGESAMLAGLLRSPQTLSPWNNFRAAENIRNVVLRQMRDLGFITTRQMREESDKPLQVQPRSNPHRVSYSHDLIRQQAIAALGFERAMNGGYRIYTTLDKELQTAAEAILAEQLAKIEQTPNYPHETYADYRRRHAEEEARIDRGNMAIRLPPPVYLQGALLALENNTGAILAMVGGRDFRHSEYNRAFQARRPIGTAFTPFVFASAYSNNIPPNTLVDDSCLDNRFVMVGGETGILGEWGVERPDNEYEGPMPATFALIKGKNAATVRLGFVLGLERFRQTLAALGIRSPIREYSNAFLGSSEMTLEEVTLAYTAFPNQGRRPEFTYIIQRIEDAAGREIYRARPQLARALPSTAAYQVHQALEKVLTDGTDNLAYNRDGLEKFPAAGKNGTAYGFTDVYFFGYTSEVTCGVWIGFDKPTRIYRGAFGRDLAMPVWVRWTNLAARKFPPRPFPRPLDLEPVEICAESGLLATPKCVRKKNDVSSVSTAYIEYLTPSQKPKTICDVHAGGIRSYAKTYEESDWPRAAPAIDLSRIRPIAIQQPTIVGANDVYQAVQPGFKKDLSDLPVAKAIPVEFADGSKAEAATIGQTAEGRPVAAAIPVRPPENSEIRRAESLPAPATIERPALELQPPPPTSF